MSNPAKPKMKCGAKRRVNNPMAVSIWSLVARKSFQGFWEACYKVVVRGMGHNIYDGAHNGEHRALGIILKDLDRDKPVIFDVGANNGDYSALVLSLRPQAVIHAFEPNPPTFERLKNRFANATTVTPVQTGVSSQDGEMELFDYAAQDGSTHASFLPGGIEALNNPNVNEIKADRDLKKTKVPITSLDGYIAANRIEHIDFLKIDVEGHEGDVLEGAAKSISDGVIANIQLELNVHNAITGLSLYKITDMLSDFDAYKILPDGLYPIRYDAIYDIFRYSNYLFRRK